jgi:uncharacterized alpha-E superfamily protein
VLARIAHELFWLGRNVARAEHTARMIDGIFQADLQGRPDDPAGVTISWSTLLLIMGASFDGGDARDRALSGLLRDPENPSSVIACVERAREGARTVRDVISAEMWEAINTFAIGFDERRTQSMVGASPYSIASYVKARSALFWGVADRTMLRDEAYAFLEAGGRFESADMVLRMLRVALPPGSESDGDEGSPQRDGQALALLQAVGGLQAYRRAMTAPPNAVPVARFLLFTLRYPDSVAASVDAVCTALSAADSSPRSSEPVLRLSRLSADLEFRGRAAGEDGQLQEVCEIVQRELALTDHDIVERYFGGASVVEHFVSR